ncbi:zinc finger, CCHC-type containing protein [Tanacetum coccineum]
MEAPGSQPIAYYLKHKINEKLIKGLVNNNIFNNSRLGTRVGKKKGKEYKVLPRGPVYDAILKKKITKKEDIRGNFEIPCSIGDLKHVNALVDQGSDVNVIPYSTYMKLTDKRPADIDIRLSLASHSYIYPLGIAEDVLVEVVEHVYPVDFVILDIKENEKRPFILGTPFLTTAKALIKFDKGTITLRSVKSKASPGMGSKDKASFGKGDEVQPMEEQKFQRQASHSGAENLAVDHLSRLKNPDLGAFTEEEIADEFPDEYLMLLKNELNDDEPWYADYVNYIVGKIVPPNRIPKKRFFS